MAITKVSPGLLDLDSGITISTADNSDNITLISTDADANSGPTLSFFRNSSSPADNDNTGLINFIAENDASEQTTYGSILMQLEDVSNGSEDASFYIQTIKAGSIHTPLRIKGTETIFNEDSVDIDFRVESDGNANMLFVDGGNNKVGIGTNSPGSLIDIEGVHSQLRLTDSDDSKFVLYSYSGGKLIVRNNSTDTTTNQFTLTEDGDFGLGTISPSSKFHIADSGALHAQLISSGGDAKLSLVSSDSHDAWINYSGATNEMSAGYDRGNSTFNFCNADTIASNIRVSIRSAGGITFNGDTAEANGLDDYEEGNFTPTFVATGGTAPSGQTGTGQYTKIGDVVHITGQITWTGAGSGGSNMYIALPFAVISDSRAGMAVGLQAGIQHSSNHTLFLVPELNASVMYLIENQPDSAGHTHLNYGNVVTSASSIFSFSGCYHTSA